MDPGRRARGPPLPPLQPKPPTQYSPPGWPHPAPVMPPNGNVHQTMNVFRGSGPVHIHHITYQHPYASQTPMGAYGRDPPYPDFHHAYPQTTSNPAHADQTGPRHLTADPDIPKQLPPSPRLNRVALPPRARQRRRHVEDDPPARKMPKTTTASRRTHQQSNTQTPCSSNPLSDVSAMASQTTNSKMALDKLLEELEQISNDETLHRESVRLNDAILMAELAATAEPASIENSTIRMVSVEKATELLRDENTLPGPLLVEVGTGSLPYESLESVLEVDKSGLPKTLDAQDSSKDAGEEHQVKKMKIADVRSCLTESTEPQYPLNFLSCHPKTQQGSIPVFLSQNYLSDLYDNIVTGPKEKGRCTTLRKKNPVCWMTFSQAGSLTRPHQDANGWGTVLTCAEGMMLIFILDRPSSDVLSQFHEHPERLPVDAQWRMVTLQPGWSLIMEPGTVHAVARHRGGSELRTWTLGNHFLKKTQIGRMAELCAIQIKHPNCINEDEILEAIPYLISIGQTLANRPRSDPVSAKCWGGLEETEKFWRNIESIDPRLSYDTISKANRFSFVPSGRKVDASRKPKERKTTSGPSKAQGSRTVRTRAAARSGPRGEQ